MTTILEKTRSSLAPLNKRILEHPYIAEAERGTLTLDKVKAFVANQYYIVSHDARSLAFMVSKSTCREEFEFFNFILKGDAEALPLLIKMAEDLGMTLSDLEDYSPIPAAVAYAHYLTTLAHFALPGEQALALVVNLPIWGSNCQRLSRALREKYEIGETSFLDLFAQPMAEVEEKALSIISHYPYEEKRMRSVAKLIQTYELMFWDGIYGCV